MELRQLPPLRLGHCLGGKGERSAPVVSGLGCLLAVFPAVVRAAFAPFELPWSALGARRAWTSLRSGRLWTRWWMPSVLKWTTSWQSCATELGGGRYARLSSWPPSNDYSSSWPPRRASTTSAYRAARLASLVERYYSRAKGGTARRKSRPARPLEKTPGGFSGGDWPAFLHYIGEAPHPDEEIATAIPAPEIFVGGAKDATAVAADLGLPADEVQRALGDVVGHHRGQPSDCHLAGRGARGDPQGLLVEFDAVHAHPAPGMKPLYGLVELTGRAWIGWVLQDGRYSPRCYP